LQTTRHRKKPRGCRSDQRKFQPNSSEAPVRARCWLPLLAAASWLPLLAAASWLLPLLAAASWLALSLASWPAWR
jgi:hypothetical protein